MKNLLFLAIFLVWIFLLNSCQPSNSNKIDLTIISFEETNHIWVDLVEKEIKEKFQIDTIVIENLNLPQSSYYPLRDRYRADKLIQYLKQNFKTEKVIGLTEKDISTSSGKHQDWGIMGLAYRPGKSCVVSTFRTFRGANSAEHKKERLKKVVFHEFGHTLGLPHCENSKSCLMRDAGGKVSTVDETLDFCLECKTQIISYLK